MPDSIFERKGSTVKRGMRYGQFITEARF